MLNKASVPGTIPGDTPKDTDPAGPVKRYLVSGLVVATLLAIAGSGYGWWHHNHPAGAQGVADAPPSAPGPLPVGHTQELPNFSLIVQEYGSAVVNLQVTGEVRPEVPDMGDTDNPLFRFFPRFGLPVPQEPIPTHGEGSGFIVSPDGVILTNAHVVDGAREVTVKLTDRREFKAKVLGVDRPTDVAVLHIEARGLPTVRMGLAEPVRVGEWVLAIGSPFGFENSATAGIVSAKARALPDEGYVPFIQTDVAVNPGNSGGPLFNQHGEVVGINSQIYSRSGGYQGLTFAIPIDVAIQVKEQILHDGKVTRGRLGIGIQDVNQDLAQSFSLKQPTGALVSSVEPGSPAQHSGLKEGDVILEVNGQPIASSNVLPPLIAAMKPGTTAILDVWRDKGQHKVSVRIGELVQEAAAPAGKQAEGGRLGLALRPLSPEERRQSGLHDGLLVLGVTGPAARAGVMDGDVILALNGTPVHNIDELRALAAKAGKRLALLVQRNDARLFIPLNLG